MFRPVFISPNLSVRNANYSILYNEKSRPRDGFFSIGISLLYLRYKKDCVVFFSFDAAKLLLFFGLYNYFYMFYNMFWPKNAFFCVKMLSSLHLYHLQVANFATIDRES